MLLQEKVLDKVSVWSLRDLIIQFAIEPVEEP